MKDYYALLEIAHDAALRAKVEHHDVRRRSLVRLVIRSLTEVALSHPSSTEDTSVVLREVNCESERLGRLINDLLSLARADEKAREIR